jgi:hypothetical protein
MSFLMRPELAGLVTLLGLSALLWANIRFPGRRASRWNTLAFQLTQLLFLLTLLMDWAYGPFLASPLGLAWMGYRVMLVPYVFAALALGWSVRGPARYGPLILLTGAEISSIVPILLWVENRITFSFLEHGTILALMSSAVSLFILTGFLIQDVPPQTSRRGRIVFSRRERTLDALPRIAQALGLDYEGPRSILEVGSLEGALAGGRLRVDSSPSLRPPRYRLQIIFVPSPTRSPGDAPDAEPTALPEAKGAIARAETAGWSSHLAGARRSLEYQSNKEMPFGEDELGAMIAELTRTPEPSQGDERP